MWEGEEMANIRTYAYVGNFEDTDSSCDWVSNFPLCVILGWGEAGGALGGRGRNACFTALIQKEQYVSTSGEPIPCN